jgi:hypothetical protein
MGFDKDLRDLVRVLKKVSQPPFSEIDKPKQKPDWPDNQTIMDNAPDAALPAAPDSLNPLPAQSPTASSGRRPQRP